MQTASHPKRSMASASQDGQRQSPRSSWWRVLRPLIVWIVLVLGAVIYFTHQRLSQQTRLLFSVSLQGQPILNDGFAALGGRPVMSGDQISIGWHTLAVSHPKASLF